VIKLIHGDCLEIMPTLEAGSVDAIIADIPYGQTACKWDAAIPFDAMWECIKHVIKPCGAVVLFGAQPFASALIMSNPKHFRYDLVWQKTAPVGFLNAKKMPLRSHELILIFYKSLPTYNPQFWNAEKSSAVKYNNSTMGRGIYNKHTPTIERAHAGSTQRYPTSVIKFSNNHGCQPLFGKKWENKAEEVTSHPTQKPVALMEYLVKTYTNEGETVLDFTMGSGSTGKAAINTNRRFIGIEKDPEYFAIAQCGINEAQMLPQVRMQAQMQPMLELTA